MVVDRPRGCPAPGHRRLHILLVWLLAVVSAGACLAPASASARRPGNPLTRRAIWIWELPYTNGGSIPAIIAEARRYGVGTVMLKSSDGTSFWSSQFSHAVVSELHAGGLRICAWQYVYGNHPITEAYMGADAVHDGADCLVIDAESEYEGKYVQAQSYLRRLRRLIGYGYPLALAGFPYIDYHPAFPYSIFLGPGGAQDNVPQMYWKDIGTTVDAVYAHTYAYNRIYKRPIFPLGQIYSSPPARQIVRFRQLSRLYRAGGVSWWDWQEAQPGAWNAVSRPAGRLPGYAPVTGMATISRGMQGDLVVWAQEHLISAGYALSVDGSYGAGTASAVQSFQAAHGLTPDGVIGTGTWAALLRYRTARITWTKNGARKTMTVRSARAGALSIEPVPKSASRPARRYEIPRSAGAGGHPGP